jgi:two-component system sensor histidine kinase AlgZ
MNTPTAAPTAAPAGDEPSSFLPDFCSAQAVLAIVAVSALLAIVLALARQGARIEFWIELARMAGYLLWTGLLCTAVLCRSRGWLARHSLRDSALLALALIVGTVALVSEGVYWAGRAWESRLGVSLGIFPARHWAFVLPNLGIAAIVGAVLLRYFYVANEWKRSVELEARSRIRALQARIRPHFLFNSMNTIADLTRSDPARAEEAIEDLADLFRVSLSDARTQITLREELEVARIYQRIEQLRLGERLQVRWNVAELPPHAVVPSLLLQPLLENAINHGIEPLPEGGTVTVEGRVDGGDVNIEVVNPVSAVARAVRSGNRMALDNIRQRLDLVFPGRAAVEVTESGGEYRVRLRFPLELGAAEPAPRK